MTRKVILCQIFLTSILAFSAAHDVAQQTELEHMFDEGFISEASDGEAMSLYREALKESKSDPVQAMEFGLRSARYGFVHAIHFVGTLVTDEFEKAKWFSLANQVHWLNSGKNYQPSFVALKALRDNKLPTRRLRESTAQYFIVNTILNYERLDHKVENPVQRMGLMFDLLNLIYGQDSKKNLKHAFFLIGANHLPDAQLDGLARLFKDYPRLLEEAGYPLAVGRILAPITQDKNVHNAHLARSLFEQVLLILVQGIYVEKASYSTEEYDLFALAFHWMSMFPDSSELNNCRGLFMAKKLVALHLDDHVRDQEAAHFFRSAGVYLDAYENLAWLYFSKKIGLGMSRPEQLQMAIDLWEKSDSYKARKNRIGAMIELFNITESLETLLTAREDLKALAEDKPEDSAMHLALAQINLDIFIFVDGQDIHFLDESEFHGRRAYELGDRQVADMLLIELAEIRALQEEKILASDGGYDDEPLQEVSLPSSSSSSSIHCPKKQSKKLNKTEKKIRSMRRRQEEFRKMAPMGQTIHRIGDTRERLLELDFINGTVMEQFHSLDQKKKKEEIFNDIICKPWGTEGVGKPEVLRSGKYKGCISRRLDHENRLVYRVVGENRIEIVACVGHYL